MKIQSNMYINNPDMTSRNIEKKENSSHALVQEDDIQISDSARKLVETARNKVSDFHTMHFSSIMGEIREIPAEYKCENLFKSINEQISNFAQTYPTNLKASSNEALLFMRRYRFANCSCFSCCFKDAYPSSNVQ